MMLIYQLPSANTINVSYACMKIVREKAKLFHAGLDYGECYNGSWYVNASIEEIYTTLLQAVGLRVLIVFVTATPWESSTLLLPMNGSAICVSRLICLWKSIPIMISEWRRLTR